MSNNVENTIKKNESDGKIIEWGDEFLIGIREIDNQHKQLVGLINALHQMQRNHSQEFLDRVFNTLIEYTKVHFYQEEQLLKNVGYPGFEEHKKGHASFVRQLYVLRDGFKRDVPETAANVLQFLKAWLTTHILVHDMEYRDFMKERRIKC